MDTNGFLITITKIVAAYIGWTLLTSAPFVIAFFQTTLVIRDNLIIKREGYNSADDNYTMLYWVSTIMTYIGVAEFGLGIYFIISSL